MTSPGPRDRITDVEGIAVGNAEDERIVTGVTVVLPESPVMMSIDVRGGGAGTKDSNLLDPASYIEEFHGVVLSGGSEFGLDAAAGVTDWLSARGVGLPRGPRPIPVVPGAILFDLRNGGDKDWGDVSPYRDLAIAACEAAAPDFAFGPRGAGRGAVAGDVPGGLGSASAVADDFTVGALAVVNSFGVVVPEGEMPDGPADVPMPKLPGPGENTTLAVVATDLDITKAEARRVAIMAQDGLARAIRPVHTPFDGDTVFVMATRRRPVEGERPVVVAEVGTLAADCVARSVRRAVSAGANAPDAC